MKKYSHFTCAQDWSIYFKTIFNNCKIDNLLEFGLGLGTQFLLDNCNSVTSFEISVSEDNDEWYEKCIADYKEYQNWNPIYYKATDEIIEANSRAMEIKYPIDYDKHIKILSDVFSKTVFKDGKKYDIIFVDAGIHNRGDIVNLCFDYSDIIAVHDSSMDENKIVRNIYGYNIVKAPDRFVKIHFENPYMGTTFWIDRKNEKLIHVLSCMGDILAKGFYTGCVNSGNLGDDILFDIFINSLAYIIRSKYNVNVHLEKQIEKPKDISDWYLESDIGVVGGGSLIHPEEISYTIPIKISEKNLKTSMIFGTGMVDSPNNKIPIQNRIKILSGDYSDFGFPYNKLMEYNAEVLNICKNGGMRGKLDCQIIKQYYPEFNKSFIYDPGLLASFYFAPSKIQLPESDNIIGINPCHIGGMNRICIDGENIDTTNNRINEVLIQFCKYALESGNFLIFYTMSQSENQICEHIIDKIKDERYNDKIIFLNKSLSVNDVICLCKKMKLAIAVRLHGNILANSANTPTINIAYHFKNICHAQSIEQYQYVIPTNELLTFENLKEKYEKLNSEIKLQREIIYRHIERAKNIYTDCFLKITDELNMVIDSDCKIQYDVFNGQSAIFQIIKKWKY